MNTLIIYLLIIALLIATEELYFFLAARYGIVDRPNHRTLHEQPTIRGGGIIFPVSVILHFGFFGSPQPLFLIGLIVAATISFIDDLGHVHTLIRFGGQLLAMSAALISIGYWEMGVPFFLLILVVAIGAMNAYNFMDGINGITVGYSFVLLVSLYFINETITSFISQNWLICVGLGLIIFAFYNFRNRARCFSGDVGSISIALILIHLTLLLIFNSGNFIYVLLFAVYGVDSVLTIVHRLLLKENIFEAHRSHLFQVLVYHGKYRHLTIAIAYMVVQLFVNILLVYALSRTLLFQVALSACVLLVLALSYIALKRKFLRLSVAG